jgi:fructoselysine-6-P-deglycase FrlB-like protein
LLQIVLHQKASRVSITADEIATQPELWRRAAIVALESGDVLPAAGERTCVIGCGTSLFMAQAWASLRESLGCGETDAFAGSEVPAGRSYDVLVAISRSGTTTEIVRALERAPARRTLAITAVPRSPVAEAADAVIELAFADEQSVVQTRFATTGLSLLRSIIDPEAAMRAADDAELALAQPLPIDHPAGIEQWTFLGRGWTVGLAHEAALKLRESAQAWAEAYSAFEYRHGPISIAAPARVVWSHGPLDAALATRVGRTGATVVAPTLDPLASLVLAQRVAVALAEARGLDPDRPRHLTRSVVLSDGELGALAS